MGPRMFFFKSGAFSPDEVYPKSKVVFRTTLGQQKSGAFFNLKLGIIRRRRTTVDCHSHDFCSFLL